MDWCWNCSSVFLLDIWSSCSSLIVETFLMKDILMCNCWYILNASLHIVRKQYYFWMPDIYVKKLICWSILAVFSLHCHIATIKLSSECLNESSPSPYTTTVGKWHDQCNCLMDQTIIKGFWLVHYPLVQDTCMCTLSLLLQQQNKFFSRCITHL